MTKETNIEFFIQKRVSEIPIVLEHEIWQVNEDIKRFHAIYYDDCKVTFFTEGKDEYDFLYAKTEYNPSEENSLAEAINRLDNAIIRFCSLSSFIDNLEYDYDEYEDDDEDDTEEDEDTLWEIFNTIRKNRQMVKKQDRVVKTLEEFYDENLVESIHSPDLNIYTGIYLHDGIHYMVLTKISRSKTDADALVHVWPLYTPGHSMTATAKINLSTGEIDEIVQQLVNKASKQLFTDPHKKAMWAKISQNSFKLRQNIKAFSRFCVNDAQFDYNESIYKFEFEDKQVQMYIKDDAQKLFITVYDGNREGDAEIYYGEKVPDITEVLKGITIE